MPVKIHGKDYSTVAERIQQLNENKMEYSLNSEYEYYPDRLMWVVKATLTIGEKVFNGLAQEIETDKSSMVNATSALENAETSAWGRALAAAGYAGSEIASADEIQKAVERKEFKPKALGVVLPNGDELRKGKSKTGCDWYGIWNNGMWTKWITKEEYTSLYPEPELNKPPF